MMARLVTLLPEPDSPTSATVSRGPIVNETSRTTRRQAPSDLNEVDRFVTERTGGFMRNSPYPLR